ncbi:MAG: 50S ribosomal protein L25 [Phycisphaerales bacterium]|nr:50S ribosomal protein L25 [Phycisphaerales bacterium]
MAHTTQLQVQSRTALGSRSNRRLRRTGVLPGVIYGHKQAIVPITLPGKELALALDHGTHLFDLNLDGQSEKALIKEVQYDHLGKEIIHVDFTRVSLDERVRVTVSLELKGEAPGEKDGGVVQQILNEIEIECLVTEIPDSVLVDISGMALDAEIRVKDLKLPENIKALAEKEQMVVSCHTIEEEAPAEPAAEGAAEPEVIGRKVEEAPAPAAGAAAEKKAPEKK